MFTWHVYYLYDKDDVLLYIGVTNDLVRRLWQHMTYYDSPFRHDIHHWKSDIYFDVDQANYEERMAILRHVTPYNERIQNPWLSMERFLAE